jgi:hypothetical protein
LQRNITVFNEARLTRPVAGYAPLSMWSRSAVIEPNRNVPCGSCASIDPSE